jgi:hypothetical protein
VLATLAGIVIAGFAFGLAGVVLVRSVRPVGLDPDREGVRA